MNSPNQPNFTEHHHELFFKQMKNIRDNSVEIIERLTKQLCSAGNKLKFHKSEARQALKDEDEKLFELNMALIGQFKNNLDYSVNQAHFYESCANWIIEDCIKYNEICLEWEYETMEKAMDESVNVMVVDFKGQRTHKGEGSTLQICNSMKRNKERRDMFLENMATFEKFKEYFVEEEFLTEIREEKFNWESIYD